MIKLLILLMLQFKQPSGYSKNIIFISPKIQSVKQDLQPLLSLKQKKTKSLLLWKKPIERDLQLLKDLSKFMDNAETA